MAHKLVNFVEMFGDFSYFDICLDFLKYLKFLKNSIKFTKKEITNSSRKFYKVE